MVKPRRVAITGMGVITPLGLTVTEFWGKLCQGRSGVRRVSRFDVSEYPAKVMGEVVDFDPENYFERREARRMALFTQYGCAALKQAMEDARLDMAREDAHRVGVEIGSAIGGIIPIVEQATVFREKGWRQVNPAFLPSILTSTAACHAAVLFGFKGPTMSPVAACATGNAAIGDAMRRIQYGDAEVMLAGGTEAVELPLAFAVFGRLGALSVGHEDDPPKAIRPFDKNRDGTVMSDGAAVIVLEEWEHAVRRDAPILAEVVGYALTEDAYHLVAPDPSGDGAARAMRAAIADAGMSPDEIDLIIPHGTGTPLNDVSETLAIKDVFGERAYKIPVSANKSMLGHMLGAAGAISTAAAVLSMRDNIIPPTINLETPDPECDLDYVPQIARKKRVDVVLVNGFGFGGQNATLVIRRVDSA